MKKLTKEESTSPVKSSPQKKEPKRSEEEKYQSEIKLIMQLPEVHELIKYANPNNIDLYQSAFTEGGELESYAKHIRKKLIQIKES